jgi:hypothetical protein
MRAVRTVDHFSVSVDAFHEREVPRADVFRLLRVVMAAGIPVSLHAVGTGPADPYLADLTAQIRRVFGGQVPMLVNTVRAVGRAAGWAGARPVAADPGQVLPCAMAAWPVVAHDGVVLACCNQEVVDRRPAPAHLTLGHIARDGWPTIRSRALSSPMLRMIRTVGPLQILERFGADRQPPEHGYCRTCHGLAAPSNALERLAGGPVGELLDRRAARVQYDAGPVAFVRRYGCARYAELVAPSKRPA